MSKKKKKRTKRRSSAPMMIIAAAALCTLCVLGFQKNDGKSHTNELRISEVVTNAAVDWIEVENISEKPVNPAGYVLMRAEQPASSFVFPTMELAPGEHAVVYADDSTRQMIDGQCHAAFRLSASGENIVLLDRNNRQADEVHVPALMENAAYCRSADDGWQVTAASTPGSANVIRTAEGSIPDAVTVRPGELEISEVMSANATYLPDENGQIADIVEIRNSSSAPVSLAGWTLSDDRGDLKAWTFPDVQLQPGECLAVYCDGQERDLHASFRLSSSGEEIYLTRPDGTTVSSAAVPAQEADQSWSLMGGEWSSAIPSPGYANDTAGMDAAAEEIRSRNAVGVYISELSATMAGSHDWIELHNGSGQPVDLSGFGLSDNSGRPRKWQFPAGTVIQPGEYMIVYASGLNAAGHTDFRLSADGGYCVTLSDGSGNVLDRIYVPEQYSDMSYGRLDGQSGLRYLETATLGAANYGGTSLGRAPQAVYSVRGGFFNTGEAFTVTLDVPAGCRAYYTTDLTDPDESDTLYTGPITVNSTTILRTRVFRDGYKPSYMDTQSYLYDVKNGGGSVYVVSLVSDPYNLTSDEAGILVRGDNNNIWQDWEREAHVEIFDQGGSMLLSQECAVRQQGQTTRDHAQQSLKLLARGIYGNGRFEGDLFTRNDFTVFNSLILRTSNDDANKSRMRDSVLSGLSIETGLMYQETEVCVVYLNGQYWGHYNLREAVNTQSICQYEGWIGEEDNIDLVVGNDEVLQGSNETFKALLDWMKQNASNTDEAYRKLDESIDVQNYIEYMVTQICVGNTDPSNIKRYRNPNGDGKWRWIVFDMDWAFNQDTNSISRWLKPGGVGNGGRTDNSFFIACMKNKTFRDQFLTTLGQRMATTFSAENVLNAFESRYAQLATILPDHFERWGTDEAEYKRALDHVLSYAKSRPRRLLTFLKINSRLDLSRTEMEHYFGAAMAAEGLTYDQIPNK